MRDLRRKQGDHHDLGVVSESLPTGFERLLGSSLSRGLGIDVHDEEIAKGANKAVVDGEDEGLRLTITMSLLRVVDSTTYIPR